ncbi:MAG: lamin tail domain-containing protein [Chloroflexota bacterium]
MNRLVWLLAAFGLPLLLLWSFTQLGSAAGEKAVPLATSNDNVTPLPLSNQITNDYVENFDEDNYWKSIDGGGLNSYGTKAYTNTAFSHITFYADVALRETAGQQDGFDKTRSGAYAWRLRNATGSFWRATISSGGVGEFSVWVRRWDDSPNPNYIVEYSIDSGNNWTFVQTINNTWLEDSSDWKEVTGTINQANGSGTEDEIIIQIRRVGGERLMVDDFAMTTYAGTLPTPTPGPSPTPTATPEPPAPEADLALLKTAPALIPISDTLPYTLTIHNLGTLPATAVFLTDTLPAPLTFVADDGQFPHSRPAPNLIVWEIGTVTTDTAVTLHFTTTIAPTATGWLTNTAWVTTAVTETNHSNNSSSAATLIQDDRPPLVLIDAVLYDGYELNDLDEAVALRSLADYPIALDQWQLINATGNRIATIPPGTTLPPHSLFWLTRNGPAFERQFGFAADLVLNGWPVLGNNGGTVVLRDAENNIIDVLVYKQGDNTHEGWLGPAVEPYRVGTLFGEEGQILYRMRDQDTGLPVPDTNSAADWAQSTLDVINGRKIQYAGWELDRFFFPYAVTETAVITLSIAPDNSYDTLVDFIAGAQQTITIESMTFEHLGIADALVAASQRGVSVTLLLDGTPPGGYTNQGRYICQQIETAGGACYFMASDQENRVRSRYRFLHAKFIIIDGRRVLISSENLSPTSHPDDDKTDGTWGRRGLMLLTDAPGVVAHVQSIFDHDRYYRPIDIHRWQTDHPIYGPPPSGFVPITETGGIGYGVRYPQTAVFQGTFPFTLIQGPENSLRDSDGLLGLVHGAGAGDVVLVQQLTERPYWGTSTSNPQDDPNPRLEAYLAAARRGASVHLLLDSYFDEQQAANSNANTCVYIRAIAQAEQLDLDCATTNPTGQGIHNKMVLVQIEGQGYIHIGSINGTEQSNKGNRELAVQFQSNEAYALLADMFWRDWPYRAYLPLIFESYVGPANHVLISEVLYDPVGPDVAEFIELVNPAGTPIDISGYGIGDAVNPDDYEDMRRFPPGTILGPQQTIVIATTATGFYDYFGFNPDYEVVDTDPTVPVLPKDPHWGHPDTFIQLGNQGDEVLLLDANNQLVDILVYGNGSYPGITPCPLVAAPGRSLERYPYWRHTGYCPTDFREWPFPNPGSLP